MRGRLRSAQDNTIQNTSKLYGGRSMDSTSPAVCPVYTKSETRGRIDLCGIRKHQINASA